MNKAWKIIIVLLLISAVAAVVVRKKAEMPKSPPLANTETPEPKKLPTLLELGADKCIPCKMMKPILDELTKEYAGKLQVEFYDVWKDPAPSQKYGVRIIPTQIFFDADGKELFRHEGFYSKEDILGKWKELGVNLEKGTGNESK